MNDIRVLSDAQDQRPAVLIEFFSQPEKDEDASRAAGHAVFRDVEMARWYKRGSNGQATECKVDRMPKFYPAIWNAYRPAYEAWKAGQEPPLAGVPLTEWPAITRAEVETLRALHIRTVEDLAGVTDADGQRIGMGWRALRDKARAFMATAADRGKLAEALAERDAKIAAQAGEIAELRGQVQQLIASLDAASPRQPPPKRRDAAA